jgi:DNA-binding transcriptional ArsR family regulator
MDTLSGTLGLAGGVDGALVLGKEQDGSKYLWGNGRDSVAGEFKISVQQDERLHWENLGQKIDDVGSEQRAQIIAALAKAAPRPMGIEEITKAVGGKKPNVKRLIYKLRDAGIIESVAPGVYRLPVEEAELDIEEPIKARAAKTKP